MSAKIPRAEKAIPTTFSDRRHGHYYDHRSPSETVKYYRNYRKAVVEMEDIIRNHFRVLKTEECYARMAALHDVLNFIDLVRYRGPDEEID